LQVQPRLLDPGAGSCRADRLDSGDRARADVTHRQDTGAHGLTFHVHGARATLSHPAAKLGTGKTQHITQNPQQRHIVGRVDLASFAIDEERHLAMPTLLAGLYASIYSQRPATAIARWYCPPPGGARRPAKLEVRRTIGMAIRGPWHKPAHKRR